MTVSVFNINKNDWLNFVLREFDYNLKNIVFQDPESFTNRKAIACFGDFKNEEECEKVCTNDPMRYQKWLEMKKRYEGPVYRSDLLPEDRYLSDCIHLTKALGKKFYQNFINTTYLGDNKTTIRDYIAKHKWQLSKESYFL